jgi:hypothetical protein
LAAASAECFAVLALGILLFLALTFIAALIAGVGTPTAIVITAAMVATLALSRRRSGGPDIHS